LRGEREKRMGEEGRETRHPCGERAWGCFQMHLGRCMERMEFE
jgi:hypothetical protein